MITIKNNKDLDKLVEMGNIVIKEDQNVVIAPDEVIFVTHPIWVYGNLMIAGEGKGKIKGLPEYINIDIRDNGQCDISLSQIDKDCQILIFAAETGVVKVHGKRNKSWLHEFDVDCEIEDRAKLYWNVSGNLKADIIHNKNSVAYIVAKDKTDLEILCLGKSTAFISITDHSTTKIIAHDNSDCDILAREHSVSRIYSFGDSNLKIDANDSSSATIEGHGRSKVTVTSNSPMVKIYSTKYNDSNIFYKGGYREKNSLSQTTPSCR